MNRIIQVEKINDSIYCVRIDKNEYVFSFNMSNKIVLQKLSQSEALSKKEQERLVKCLNKVAYERK